MLSQLPKISNLIKGAVYGALPWLPMPSLDDNFELILYSTDSKNRLCCEESVTAGEYHILVCNMDTFQLVKKIKINPSGVIFIYLFSSEVISKAASHTAEDRNYVNYIEVDYKEYIFCIAERHR